MRIDSLIKKLGLIRDRYGNVDVFVSNLTYQKDGRERRVGAVLINKPTGKRARSVTVHARKGKKVDLLVGHDYTDEQYARSLKWALDLCGIRLTVDEIYTWPRKKMETAAKWTAKVLYGSSGDRKPKHPSFLPSPTNSE